MPKQKKNKRERISLPNGCYCTPLKVIPANWKEPGASPSIEWRVWYRFYDSEGNVKLRAIKGMNDYHTLTDRRKATEEIISIEKEKLQQGYNPILDRFVTQEVTLIPELSPSTPFIEALTKAMQEKECAPSTRIDLKSVLKYVTIASNVLGYSKIPISEVKRGHIRSILKQLAIIKKDKWTDNNYNFYRAHIGMLYSELVEWEAVEYNPIDKISKAKGIVKIEKLKVLSLDERILLNRTLRKDNYEYWRFLMIFFMAGCRRTEIMRVQGKDVDLVAQKFIALRKKGRKYVEVEYTITDEALPLWREQMESCSREDYVFSVGLLPGAKPIRYEQVTRRWKRWVKDRFGIEANFYWLKRLQSTMTAGLLGTDIAAAFNNESERMINQHYDVDKDKRLHEQLKKIVHKFAPED